MGFNLADALKDVSNLDTGRKQIEYIRLDLIDGDERNFYAVDEIERLADNIATIGLQQPLVLRENEENPGRYRIISGHRRCAALNLLVKEDPEQWTEIPCIIERDAASPTLRELQLIFGNANTRVMSDADTAKQAARVEELLYKLKEEEGYEFPGRMRDHVSEIVGISKSKLARLRVIREKLSRVWLPLWEKGKLNESVAYELARLPEQWQKVIHQTRGENIRLDAKHIKTYGERFRKIAELECKRPGRNLCHNAVVKQMRVASDSPYSVFYCGKCCADCPELASCKYVCPVHAAKAKELRADKRAARKQEIAAEMEADRPKVEKITAIWKRFGEERTSAGLSVKDVKDAMGSYYWSDEQAKYEKLEGGTAKITAGTRLPYGILAEDVSKLVAVADLFGCSLDYLLCRTDAPKPVPDSDTEEKDPSFIPGAWYATSVEPPVGKKLILMDSGGYVDTGKYKGCGEYDMDYGDPVVLWSPMPEEKDVVTTAQAVPGWQSGKPEAYGTYVAYVRLAGMAAPLLRELLWDGEEWFLFGEKISEDITVQCWSGRPDF